MLNLPLTSAADPNALQTVLQVMLGSLTVVVVIVLVMYILQIIANWRIFTKAGEHGWKSIIPVYNTYILYKISWKPLFFWLAIVASAVTFAGYALLPADGGQASPAAMPMICVGLIVSAILYIIFSYKLSKAYGHGVGFTLGLIFLTPIFLLILGLGSSQYVGSNQ